MGNIRLFLRANEKLYINGAVIRFDRKTSIELLNDVSFLLENHVMQVEDANTPLRQLYFVVQMMLMEPSDTEGPMRLFGSMAASLRQSLTCPDLLEGVDAVEQDIRTGETFRALKTIRTLFATEDRLLEHGPPKPFDMPAISGALALQNGE